MILNTNMHQKPLLIRTSARQSMNRWSRSCVAVITQTDSNSACTVIITQYLLCALVRRSNMKIHFKWYRNGYYLAIANQLHQSLNTCYSPHHDAIPSFIDVWLIDNCLFSVILYDDLLKQRKQYAKHN